MNLPESESRSSAGRDVVVFTELQGAQERWGRLHQDLPLPSRDTLEEFLHAGAAVIPRLTKAKDPGVFPDCLTFVRGEQQYKMPVTIHGNLSRCTSNLLSY